MSRGGNINIFIIALNISYFYELYLPFDPKIGCFLLLAVPLGRRGNKGVMRFNGRDATGNWGCNVHGST